MRYRVAVLMLLLPFVLLPAIYLPAAPAPERAYAILAIGPSPDPRESDEKYRKDQKEAQTCDITLGSVLSDSEVRKLPSIARMKDPLPWLRKNLRVEEEDGGRRLRFTFLAGNRATQATILNALLRDYIAGKEGGIKDCEEQLRWYENQILEVEDRINSGQHPHMVDRYREAINYCRRTQIPEVRAVIARVKQTAVIKWAK